MRDGLERETLGGVGYQPAVVSSGEVLCSPAGLHLSRGEVVLVREAAAHVSRGILSVTCGSGLMVFLLALTMGCRDWGAIETD